MRIVSLACSNTEIVAALGCGDRLVGVDDHSDFPEDAVRELPRLGPDLSIDVDAVARLEPDLVLASLTLPGHERVVERIDRAGLRWIAPDPQSLADVYRDIRDIAALLGVPERAAALVDGMESAMPPCAPTGTRVLVEWWPKPVIAPGKRSWVNQVLERAGAVNPFADRDRRSSPLTDREVIEANPDVVVISWCGVPLHRYRRDVVARRPAWGEISAIRNGRIEPITEAWLGRPGPRLVEGYRRMRQILDDPTAPQQGTR